MGVILDVKNEILTKYSQLHLFAYWLNISLEEIEYCLENTSNTISNPLRTDENPSLGFMFNDSKLTMKDWAKEMYSGDIFHLVGLVLELDSNSKDFIKICNNIIKYNEDAICDTVEIRNVVKSFTKIEFIHKEFTNKELEWWYQGGVTLSHLKVRNVFSAEVLFFNTIPAHVSNDDSPTYVYYLGKRRDNDIIQTYSPFDKKFKFKTNNRSIFQAAHELYDARCLIITKSRKDKLVIECNLEGIESDEYCITSLLNESQRCTKELGSYLNDRYETIIINTDFDEEGIKCAFYHYVLFNFKPVFIGAKGVSNNLFSDISVNTLFKSILAIDPYITLHKGILIDFVNEAFNDIKEKDCFDYCSKHGLVKGKQLINNKFKI